MNFLEKLNEGELDSYGRHKGSVIKGATVYRTDDKGMTRVQKSGKTAEMKNYMEKLSATYGWVFGRIRVDPTDENTVYVMGLGLNVSTDGGKSWSVLGDLPSTFIHDLIIQPRDNIIVIATHVRGMWAVDANLVNGGRKTGGD